MQNDKLLNNTSKKLKFKHINFGTNTFKLSNDDDGFDFDDEEDAVDILFSDYDEEFLHTYKKIGKRLPTNLKLSKKFIETDFGIDTVNEDEDDD